MQPPDNWQKWFELVWKHREEQLYPTLFGLESEGIFTLQADMLTGTFKQQSFDPRWLFHRVFQFAPTATRNSWLYVTSGMSNDWEADGPNPATSSGLGCEFVMETPRVARWAIFRLLHAMAFQILLCHGRYPGRAPLGGYHRIPLRSSICAEPSVLTWLMLAPPIGFPRQAQLESGPFEFHQLVGITEGEAGYARSHGGPALLEILRARGGFPVTNPDRQSLVEEE
jgi:hypothetical protein